MNIFRAYDIRGLVPSELNSELTFRIGKAFCKFLKPKTIIVGYDARNSSPRLYSALVKGIRSQNVKVISIGLTTTPMFYYALNSHKVDGGIMITSSHSPLNTNGLKLCSRKAKSIHESNGLKKIKQFTEQRITHKRKGRIKHHKTFREYNKYMRKFANKSNLKIGVDGSSMCGVIDYRILKRLYRVKGINIKLKSKKPYFQPNPLIKSNLRSIKELVKRKKLDLGVFFDGDCDRVMFIDEKGKTIAVDIIAALLIDKYKYKKILKDSQSSKIIDEICKKNKTTLLRTKVGHSLVDSKLKKTKANFGLERSGHYYFKDFFYKDNALLAVIKLINIMDKPLSQLVKTYQKYYHSGEINFKIKNKDQLIEKLVKTFKHNKIIHFDGVKFISKNYWFYIRKSKTQDLIRLNIEANTKKELKTMKLRLSKLIKGYN